MVGSGDCCIPNHDVETVRGGAHGNVGGPTRREFCKPTSQNRDMGHPSRRRIEVRCGPPANNGHLPNREEGTCDPNLTFVCVLESDSTMLPLDVRTTKLMKSSGRPHDSFAVG